ncbi:uncharacterized protein si:ch211-14k19.8 [Melanotaenia boesemani]|uniref:uncharacterized protein si:ch211-14k19.8 n=1 Tax=Melanotaenia boesemani TaxID=1250792 RepID=UPI001C03DF78|nr:uncharacterized protein si:ch211-14k19.8 [Melanotaenia boesemani]
MEMQLHACLLLFIITTDKTLASSNHHCGGSVSLDQEPSGRISLILPGLFTDTSRPNHTNQPSDETLQLSVCTWILNIPPGRVVFLKAVELERGSNISVHCAWNKDPQALQSGDTALLSGCDRDKATIRWTGAQRFPNAVQLVYNVQEDEKNSLEVHSTHQPDQDSVSWSQTGTTFANTATVAQEILRGTEEGRGRLDGGLVWSFGPQSVSSVSFQDKGLLRPTSPQQGLPDAGRADREILPLPEEKLNNGADTSGVVHLTDDPTTARTHPHFQRAFSADIVSKAVNPTDLTLSQTEMSWTDAAVSHSISMLGTDIHNLTSTQTSQHTDKHTQTDQSVSGSSVILTSSSPEIPTWEGDPSLIPHGGAISQTEDKQPFSWRSQQNTERLNPGLTSTTTLDPIKSSTKPLQHDSSSGSAVTVPTTLFSQDSSRTHSLTTHISELETAAGAVEAASANPNTRPSDSFISDASVQTAEFELSEKLENTDVPSTLTYSTQSQTNSPKSTEILKHSAYTSSLLMKQSNKETQTATETTQNKFMSSFITINPVSSLSEITKDDGQTSGFTGSFFTPRASKASKVENSTSTATTGETLSPLFTQTVLHESLKSDPATVLPLSSFSTTTPSFTHTTFNDNTHTTSAYPVTESSMHTTFVDHQPSPSPQMHHRLLLPTSTVVSPTYKQPQNFITTTYTSPLLTIKSDDGQVKVQKGNEFWQWSSSSMKENTPTAGPSPTLHVSQQDHLALTPSVLMTTSTWSSTESPMFYIVSDEPAAIRVEAFELLLQIVVEESRSAMIAGLKEDTAAWVEPYLQRAPGFTKLLEVWSSGHAVQSLVEFKASGALQWLSMTGSMSLLELTGLAQAVREGRTFRTSKITNITLGGLQGDVCSWLLQCPAGYKCMARPGTANYSCSSVCRFDYCHHHGICTHHPGQLPVCRCLVGDDFWYMGQRCDMRMTRTRLVGACLAILLIIVTVIGILAFLAVRRYRTILIQAKVDQTRSSYRRFNHFDELSGRFWLRSWAGSADSLDNPAFMRSDELLHLRALDRPCCYHDDTLSLASTCPSHGTRINTIYPHSSQYGWRGSEMSMGDGVLDSGKASDLSVCSWPVEPIHWTPFPLLQQLASHRTPTVRVSRPRSYCEGMELVDIGKSWTA